MKLRKRKKMLPAALSVSLFSLSFLIMNFTLMHSYASANSVVDAIAVWQHSENGVHDIWYAIWDDTNRQWWTPSAFQASPIAELAGNDVDPSISFDRQGNAIAVWSHETGNTSLGYDIWYSKWSGSEWSPPAEIARLAGDDADPAVAFDTDGWAISIWVHNGTFIYYSLWNGTNWIGPAQAVVSDWPLLPFWGSNLPEIAFTSSKARGYTSHKAVAIWTEWVLSPEVPPLLISRIYYALWDGTSWSPSPAEEISGQSVNAAGNDASTVFRNGISSDNLNNAVAVWATGSLAQPIYYAMWNGHFWSDATALDAQEAYGNKPAIAFNAADDAVLAFTHNTTNTWYSRYENGVWQTAAEAANSSGNDFRPSIAFLLSSRAVTVWSSDEATFAPSEIFYSVWDPANGTWTAAASIVPQGLIGSDLNPSIASTSGSPTMPPTVVTPEIHDVAVIDVSPSETVVAQGSLVSINVTVENQGTTTETFNVTAYSNTTAIATQNVTNLAPGSQTTLDFIWNTTDAILGNYIVSAQASIVQDEINTADNTFTDGIVEVTILYAVTLEAYCNTESAYVSVSITMDGNPTGYNTSHTFTGLTGTHTLTVPDTDPNGHPFKQWSTGETNTTITVNSDGTYTTYYETPPTGVGGIVVPVDKLALLAPYIALAAILTAVAVGAVYARKRWLRKAVVKAYLGRLLLLPRGVGPHFPCLCQKHENLAFKVSHIQ